MVVPIVHEDCILSFERESEPPISTHAHRPMSIQIAFEKVPLPPGKVHLFRPSGGVQREKLIGESLCMRGLDPNLGTCPKELFDSFVPEASNHPDVSYSVTLRCTTRKAVLTGPEPASESARSNRRYRPAAGRRENPTPNR